MKNKFKALSIALLGLCFSFNTCFAASAYVKKLPFQDLELTKYMGTWYEIARMPNNFEKGLIRVTATYSIKKDGRVEVKNQGYPETDLQNPKIAIGDAYIPNKKRTGALRVSFFWPFYAGYNVVALDPNYQWAMVSGDTPEYLWILSRTKTLDSKIYSDLIKLAKDLGINTDLIEKIPQ